MRITYIFLSLLLILPSLSDLMLPNQPTASECAETAKSRDKSRSSCIVFPKWVCGISSFFVGAFSLSSRETNVLFLACFVLFAQSVHNRMRPMRKLEWRKKNNKTKTLCVREQFFSVVTAKTYFSESILEKSCAMLISFWAYRRHKNAMRIICQNWNWDLRNSFIYTAWIETKIEKTKLYSQNTIFVFSIVNGNKRDK